MVINVQMHAFHSAHVVVLRQLGLMGAGLSILDINDCEWAKLGHAAEEEKVRRQAKEIDNQGDIFDQGMMALSGTQTYSDRRCCVLGAKGMAPVIAATWWHSLQPRSVLATPRRHLGLTLDRICRKQIYINNFSHMSWPWPFLEPAATAYLLPRLAAYLLPSSSSLSLSSLGRVPTCVYITAALDNKPGSITLSLLQARSPPTPAYSADWDFFEMSTGKAGEEEGEWGHEEEVCGGSASAGVGHDPRDGISPGLASCQEGMPRLRSAGLPRAPAPATPRHVGGPIRSAKAQSCGTQADEHTCTAGTHGGLHPVHALEFAPAEAATCSTRAQSDAAPQVGRRERKYQDAGCAFNEDETMFRAPQMAMDGRRKTPSMSPDISFV
ncbi:hypothetical protein B0H14DRAFT_2631340 [Mycena olivaceomarginata]|nr:hypothetical protein B0H14DRAFT_2631340 [Mycena olivaceomarginata]